MNSEKSKIQNLNYKTDILLSNKKIYGDKVLNLYGLLLKREEMTLNNKGMILKKCPYINDKNSKILQLIQRLKDKNFIMLRQALSDYLLIKRIRRDTLYKWLEKKIFPLPLLRITCFLINKDILGVMKDPTITDFCMTSQIKIPSSPEIINSDFMAYFVGLHLGDGTLNKERWKIVDGDEEKQNLIYSEQFFQKIADNLKKMFSITITKPFKIKDKNAYELIISNKWFCRYLHFVYGVEYSKKEEPKIPALLNPKRLLVLRGLFDTDGSIKDYRISFGTRYLNLFNEICAILDEEEINYRTKINKIERRNGVYILEIKKDSTIKFIKKVGFSHPRKILEVKKYLLTNSSSRSFIRYNEEKYKPKISKEEFIELCNLLRPIRNSGKIRFISDFNKLESNKKEKILQNLKINFDVEKEPNPKGNINSYQIQRILTDYCSYTNDRIRMSNEEIKWIIEKLEEIWR
jgi:hypothetical protein